MKILHAADLHLDSPFGGLPPERARERRRESRELADRLAELAASEGAELVLLSGDLFDGERVYPETLERLKSALAQMACPVFIAPGNHDPYTARSPYQTGPWPENVYIFRRSALTAVALPELGCVVHGAAFTGGERTDQVLADFTAPEDGLLHILCLHGDVFSQDSVYGPITRPQIARSGADYLALGHVHQCSGLQRQGDTPWAYPGCPEGRGFDELGEKGVLYLEAAPGHVTAQFVPLAKRRYEILTVDLTGAADPLAAVRAALPGDTENLICRLILTGEGQPPSLPALERALAPDFYGLTLIDRTRLPRDLWARREEDALTGLFLQAMWDRCQELPDDPVCQLAARYGLAALEGGEEV